MPENLLLAVPDFIFSERYSLLDAAALAGALYVVALRRDSNM
jgi:hypothetical protein